MKRGAYDWEDCMTPLCKGASLTRCFLCGGITSVCACHSCDYDTCICGAQASCWADVRLINFVKLGMGLFREFWCLLKYNDSWWFLNGWRGK